jgi:hypothetical protein
VTPATALCSTVGYDVNAARLCVFIEKHATNFVPHAIAGDRPKAGYG